MPGPKNGVGLANDKHSIYVIVIIIIGNFIYYLIYIIFTMIAVENYPKLPVRRLKLGE